MLKFETRNLDENTGIFLPLDFWKKKIGNIRGMCQILIPEGT
jgi:hypothetical protein